jgi:hypothetical protein
MLPVLLTACTTYGEASRLDPGWNYTSYSRHGASLALPNEPIAGPDELQWASPWQGMFRVCYVYYAETQWRRSELGFAPGCDCAGAPPVGSYALLVESF